MADSNSDQAQDWSKILDSLLSGVAHHISNRVAVLSGISDLLAADASPSSQILQALAAEVPKLEESVQLLRLLSSADESPEALEPVRLVNNAIALAELHPDFKHLTLTIVGEQIPPVLARPTAVTHEILMAIVHAAAETTGGVLCVSLKVVSGNVLITAGRYSVPVQTLLVARQTTAS